MVGQADHAAAIVAFRPRAVVLDKVRREVTRSRDGLEGLHLAQPLLAGDLADVKELFLMLV